ncbi:hypothetical protein MYAM1_001148 [Malassezia yamatoensis]|uniref:Plasma membrane proteolipid 3 n=1 Tax=Malassezia yamatoensis TaxID=253288 RepID=A0AAJ5YTD2_9BASI|nr:hypothetical protein MYAM1_001148 [Malassezia yamatoensis]
MIVLFSILVPPLAVAMRFGIGTDFFINVVLTCLGYIPGHMHNFFVQRIRNNTGDKRTPKWLKRCGLVVNPSNAAGGANNKWSERYLYIPDHVQHDDEGRAYYLNPLTQEFDAPTAPRRRAAAFAPDSDQNTYEDDSAPDALVEPDRYYNQSSSNKYQAPTSAYAATSQYDSDITRAPNRSLMARTRKFLGGQPPDSGAGTLDRHSRISRAMSTTNSFDSHSSRYDADYGKSRMQGSSAAPTGTLDDLDQELLGLSTNDPAPAARRASPEDPTWRSDSASVSTTQRTSSRGSYRQTPAANEVRQSERERPARQRDIMEYEHTF